MINLNDVYSLTEFQRNAREHLERLAQTGRPQVLTVNGKAVVVVQDAASYQQMVDEMGRLRAEAGIQRGIDAMKRGETRPLSHALDDLKPDTHKTVSGKALPRLARPAQAASTIA